MTAAAVAPYLGVGQLVTARLAPLPARRTLIACDLLRAAVYLTMATYPPVALLLLLEFVSGSFSVPFESIRSALLPSTVPEGQYGDALAVATMTKEFALLVGYLGGGILFAALGPRWLLALNAGTFLVSAALLLGLPRPRRRAGAEMGRARAGIRDAARFVLGDAVVRRCVLTYAAVGGCAVVGEALAPVFVERELRAGPAAVGMLAATISAAVILFALAVPRGGSTVLLTRSSALFGLAGSAAAAGLFALDVGLPVAVLPFIALGAVYASRVPAYQVVGTRTPEHLRAAVFGVVVGAISLTSLVMPLAAGLLADQTGIRTVMVAFPAAGAVVAALAAVSPLTEPSSARRARAEAH